MRSIRAADDLAGLGGDGRLAQRRDQLLDLAAQGGPDGAAAPCRLGGRELGGCKVLLPLEGSETLFQCCAIGALMRRLAKIS
jgi:hypothetical protein